MEKQAEDKDLEKFLPKWYLEMKQFAKEKTEANSKS